MTTLPTPDAPKPLSDDEIEYFLGNEVMCDSIGAPFYARLCATLRPQAPDDKPGEVEVEALAKLVYEVDPTRDWRAGHHKYVAWDAIDRRGLKALPGRVRITYNIATTILAAGYHRQTPAGEVELANSVVESWYNEHGHKLKPDDLGKGVAVPSVKLLAEAVTALLLHHRQAPAPENAPTPSDACRERARKLLPCKCGLDYCPNPQHSSHDDDCPAFYRSKLATELQSMVRATPTREEVARTICSMLEDAGKPWAIHFKCADAILAQLSGGQGNG